MSAPIPLADVVVRVVCPTCLVGLSDCVRCNGSGYVWRSPYDEHSGEQGLSETELEAALRRAAETTQSKGAAQ